MAGPEATLSIGGILDAVTSGLVSAAYDTHGAMVTVSTGQPGYTTDADLRMSAGAGSTRRISMKTLTGGLTAPSPETITSQDWYDRVVQAAAVIYAESGGNKGARCYNVTGPDGKATCSPTPPAGPRGVDRGLWQFNSKAWPQIPDDLADNPVVATDIAFIVTRQFTTWGPWAGSKGLDRAGPKYQEVAKVFYDRLGVAVPKGILGLPGEEQAYEAIQGLGSTLGKSLGGLSSLLAWLADAELWKRIGIGALGLLLVLLAAYLTLK